MIRNKFIKENLPAVAGKAGTNLVRFAAFFIVIFAVVSMLYGRNPLDNVPLFFSFEKIIPDTFGMVLVSSLLFILFVIIVSAKTVIREQSFFKSSILIRLLIFAMNVLPIALFHYNLFPQFGYRIIYFVIILMVFQTVMDLTAKPLVSRISGKNKIVILCGIIIPEALAVFLSVLAVNVFGIDKTANIRNLEMSDIRGLITYFLYIVLFNSVTFFSVEYSIGMFKEEYKKNYSKFYFIFCHSSLKRVFYVLKGALPQVLEKIRKNISWLVMFIIAVDSIFENLTSIGSNLSDGYMVDSDIDGSLIIISNIMYLLLMMYLINTIIDVFIVIFSRRSEDKKSASEPRAEGAYSFREASITVTSDENTRFPFLPGKKGLKVFFIAAFFAVYAGLLVFNFKEYAFAGYYDFYENRNRTVKDYLDFKDIGNDRCPEDVYLYYNVPLCEQVEGTAYYSLIKIKVQDKDGSIFDLIPFYDKVEKDYYYIHNNMNMQKIFDLSLTGRILSIDSIIKYKAIAFSDEMTSFRLGTGTSRTIHSAKPVYLIIPFYLFYFFTILIIAVVFSCLIYRLIVKYYIHGESKFNKLFTVFGKTAGELLFFLNSLTLIVFFQLVNFCIQRKMDISWENKGFLASFISYSIIQIVIILMFSDSYIREIVLHVKKYIFSNEFKYYNIIGMSRKTRHYIYDRKYGRFLLLKLIFQNILFVLNINWVLSYILNVWSAFSDSIGITYAISFENIFTKIIRLESVRTDPVNYVILAVLNIFLFAGYYYYQKKMDLE